MGESRGGVYVSVGSNISPETHILEAAVALNRRLPILAVSPLYETPPVGPPNQPRFVNGVWEVETDLLPERLKAAVLRDIEATLGRVRTSDRFAPRPIDLDLIVYRDVVLATAKMAIPDPGIYKYPHIAVPLFDVAPHLVLPDRQQPVSTLTDALDRRSLVPLPSMTAQLKGILNNG